MRSLYDHAGGDEALHRLEELFYSKVLADPILKRLFTERRPHHVDRLTWFRKTKPRERVTAPELAAVVEHCRTKDSLYAPAADHFRTLK